MLVPWVACPAPAEAHANSPFSCLREKGRGRGQPGECAGRADAHQHGPYFSTTTPFQNATYPAIFFAASLGSG
jgi:hypothetical protein